VAVQLVWRVPQRERVAEVLYVTMRLMHVGGWRRVLVAQESRGACWCAVELDDQAREDDAATWAASFERRYRQDVTIDELMAGWQRFSEVYIDGGVGELLNQVERLRAERDNLRRAERDEAWKRTLRRP